MQEKHKGGTLYIVGTPIGNLEDITLRAINTLKLVDLIAAEDTRRTRKLLSHLKITKSLISYHEHNAVRTIPGLISRIEQGDNIAIVTDGGMPCISDPGYRLITKCRKLNLTITVIPGPSAVTSALALSGISAERFVFEGYLPRKNSERTKRWIEIASDKRAIVIYETPHRMFQFLREIQLNIPRRQVCICREMTKYYEEVITGSATELAEQMLDENGKCSIKGEITAVIAGDFSPTKFPDYAELDAALKAACISENSNRDAAKHVAEKYNAPFRKVYKRLLELNNMENSISSKTAKLQ
ncbi:16S rRNA (cytidine(1402)-2'-O)-methyltransferase [bacterium]|nr:16S rRNA (cytidine(1402)-2'-O)-methyltransferase [bacterium]